LFSGLIQQAKKRTIVRPNIITHPLFKPFFPLIGRLGLFVLGWKTQGKVPNIKKFVLICAPHSSNWDFVLFLLMIFKFKIPVHWMGKKSMFAPPFRSLLHCLGGIPIDRSQSGNTVSQMVSAFQRSERLIIALAPSGTRKNGVQWKTGFYHLARQANVPIVCGFVDYEKKTGGIGPVFIPHKGVGQGMEDIQAFYIDKSRKT
jgi:1-acyl-sn-glycerol-3-phosphate acyltransferase